ncbi:MAG: DUF2922 family protein [Oscillospiraceae bacterium]|nr:DUF2922 family protein [Oscillospiraceae bacterium]MBQ6481430.1 DUF2922 family protein [Anaerolineaceae bacterium]
MASKIVIDFAGQYGDVRFSYNYADPDTTVANVKALVNGLIANNTLFENPPITVKNAKIVTTTEDNYDLSN